MTATKDKTGGMKYVLTDEIADLVVEAWNQLEMITENIHDEEMQLTVASGIDEMAEILRRFPVPVSFPDDIWPTT